MLVSSFIITAIYLENTKYLEGKKVLQLSFMHNFFLEGKKNPF